jgi:small subunit ribosomal protein S21
MTENLLIEIRNGDVEDALRVLKKKCERGLFKEMKRRTFYLKPSAVKKLKSAKARQRLAKQARKRALAEAAHDKPGYVSGVEAVSFVERDTYEQFERKIR